MKKLIEQILSKLKSPSCNSICGLMKDMNHMNNRIDEIDTRVKNNSSKVMDLKKGQAVYMGATQKIDTTVNILTYILEDDEEIHEVISTILKEHSFTNFRFFLSPADFLRSLTADINICVIDHYLTGTTGLEMIKEVKEKNRNSYVIVVSGQRNFDIAIQYLNQGADKYIDKNNGEYIDVLVEYLQAGVAEASRRMAIVKFLEEKMKQE